MCFPPESPKRRILWLRSPKILGRARILRGSAQWTPGGPGFVGVVTWMWWNHTSTGHKNDIFFKWSKNEWWQKTALDIPRFHIWNSWMLLLRGREAQPRIRLSNHASWGGGRICRLFLKCWNGNCSSKNGFLMLITNHFEAYRITRHFRYLKWKYSSI